MKKIIAIRFTIAFFVCCVLFSNCAFAEYNAEEDASQRICIYADKMFGLNVNHSVNEIKIEGIPYKYQTRTTTAFRIDEKYYYGEVTFWITEDLVSCKVMFNYDNEFMNQMNDKICSEGGEDPYQNISMILRDFFPKLLVTNNNIDLRSSEVFFFQGGQHENAYYYEYIINGQSLFETDKTYCFIMKFNEQDYLLQEITIIEC